MKKINPHTIYIPLLLIALGICFWFNHKLNVSNRRFLEMNRIIRYDNDIVATSNVAIYSNIHEISRSDTTQAKHKEKADTLLQITQDFCDFLNGVEKELVAFSGGIDVKRTDGLPIDRNSYWLSNHFFDAEKSMKLENKYRIFCKKQIQTLDNQRDKDEIEKSLLLVDSSFWHDLPFLSVSSNITMLKVLRNVATVRATAFLNLYHKKAQNGYCDDYYLPFMIAPNTNMVYEGERFKGALGFCLTGCSFKRSGVNFFVDGKQITYFEDGFPYYISPKNSVGKKKIHLEMKIINPLTGQEIISQKDYTYRVLPRNNKAD